MDTDTALASRLATNLEVAFPALVDGHAARLYTIAVRYLGAPGDAEEVAQDALVRAYEAMTGYDAARIRALRLRPWLATITLNLARNRRRRIADRLPPVRLDPLVEVGREPIVPGHLSPAAVAEGRERRDELAAALLTLPGPMREAIVLRHVDGLSVAETATALGRPEGTVKAQVHRGLALLRTHLALSFDSQADRPGEKTA